MSFSDSVFLFEISVQRLTSFTKCKDYRVRLRFSDVFALQFKDPNLLIEEAYKKPKLKTKVLQGILSIPAQTVMVAMDDDSLLSKMKENPLELCVYSREDPCTLGLLEIPWHSNHTNYLKSGNQPPFEVTEKYKTFDEYTSKRIASVTLKIKLSRLTGNPPVRQKVARDKTAPTKNALLNSKELCNITPEKTKDFEGKFESKDYSSNKINMLHELQQQQESNQAAIEGFKDKIQETRSKQIVSLNKTNRIEEHILNDRIRQEFTEGKRNDFARGGLSDVSEALYPRTVVTTTDATLIDKDTVTASTRYTWQYTNVDNTSSVLTSYRPPVNTNVQDNISSKETLLSNTCNGSSFAKIIRSDTELDNTKILSIKKRWSTSSIDIKERLDTLEYIFGNVNEGPYGKQVYCVAYMTEVKDESSAKNTPTYTDESSTEKRPIYKGTTYNYHPCGETCKEDLDENKLCSSDICKIDLADDEKFRYSICDPKCEHIISCEKICGQEVCKAEVPSIKIVTSSCANPVECINKHRPMTMQDPVLPTILKMDPITVKECCIEQKIQGNMSAKICHGDDPCLCTCECTFGFVTETSYCAVCGGYEIPGDELVGTRGALPFPCPIYHNLKKGKSKKTDETGASDRTSRGRRGGSAADDKTTTNESDKDSGKKKRFIDERFKFNYGYKAPVIGHSQCALPCLGVIRPVPRNMGWLWTAENVPGLKAIAKGWRPGAISKRLLRKLNKAKQSTNPVNIRRPMKKSKKRVEEKPALIVTKRNGEYIVEMQVYDKENGVENCKPLIYTIASADKEEKLRKREKYTQKLIEQAAADIFADDPYHPEVCEMTCVPAYKQAIGLDPFAPEYPEEPTCQCDDENSIAESEFTDSGSLDLDWELHFTPPNICNRYNDRSPTKTVKIVQ